MRTYYVIFILSACLSVLKRINRKPITSASVTTMNPDSRKDAGPKMSGSNSSQCASSGGVPPGDTQDASLSGKAKGDSPVSIAIAEKAVMSRSAETMGSIPSDLTSRQNRARAPRVGAPFPWRRGGTGGGNRLASTNSSRARAAGACAGVAGGSNAAASVALKNGNARKSSSCTVQCEQLRPNYKFEKPADDFPSMFEELLRSFEDEETGVRRPSTYADHHLAYLMSEALSDEDDVDSPLSENLLYRIFTRGGRYIQPTCGATRTDLERFSLSTATACSSTVKPSGSKTATREVTFDDSDSLARPQPPSPRGYSTNTSFSDASLPPSASVTINSSTLLRTTSPPKQIAPLVHGSSYDAHDDFQNRLLSSAGSSECCSEDYRIEDESVSPTILASIHSSVTRLQEQNEKPSDTQFKFLEDNNRDTKEPNSSDKCSDKNVISFGLLAEVYKESDEKLPFRDEEEEAVVTNGRNVNNTIKDTNPIVTTHNLCPSNVEQPGHDRICSDKRIPLPEEILSAINRAIDLGKLKLDVRQAQGDVEAIKTCTSGQSDSGSSGLNNNKAGEKPFPTRSAKFPVIKQKVQPIPQPLGFFKLSASNDREIKVKHLSPRLVKALTGFEDSQSYDIDKLGPLTANNNVRRGPLYRRDPTKQGETESNKKKAFPESETFGYCLTTPPNSPIRCKAGIKFSDPVATCVTDCNTNMALSGKTEQPESHTEKESKPVDGFHGKPIDGQPEGALQGEAKVGEGQLLACPEAGADGDRAEHVSKAHGSETTADSTTLLGSPMTKDIPLQQTLENQPSLNSHPAVLLKPQEYLDFYTFLKSKKPVKKEVRRPKTKIFKLQRLMTDIQGVRGPARVLTDSEEMEANQMPIFPRGREAPPGWKPGEHGSHPITQISAEYGTAAQSSAKPKKHSWKKSKVRRKARRTRESNQSVKQSASETSVILSPPKAREKTSKDNHGYSSDDVALSTNSDFERKRQFYEGQQGSKAPNDNGNGKLGKRNKPKKVTEQVKFLKTIDDICNAEEDEGSEEELNEPQSRNQTSQPMYSEKEQHFTTSLAKYYTNKLAKSSLKAKLVKRDGSLSNIDGVRISRANLHVPSTISLDRLRAIKPPSPKAMAWPSRANHSNPNLPTTSAKWPDTNAEVLQAPKKNNKKHYKSASDWISPSKIGVSSDYREAWEQLRASYVEAKSAAHLNNSEARPEPSKKEAKEDGKKSPAKSEKTVPQKKTTAAKLYVGLKEKSNNYKLKQISKLPAPPDRSEEDTWCYSVNAMLLKAKQAMAESQDQKKATHRFPRHNSAAVVSPVIEQRATSNFLKTLLKQDAEELRLSKAAAMANKEASIKHQRDRIRNVMGKVTGRKTYVSNRAAHNSCNNHASGSDQYGAEHIRNHIRMTDERAERSLEDESQDSISASRIQRPVDLSNPQNRRSYQSAKNSPRKSTKLVKPGSSFVLEQTLKYYDFPYINDSSIVPLYGNTNTNALSEDEVEEALKEDVQHGIRKAKTPRENTPLIEKDDCGFCALCDKYGALKNVDTNGLVNISKSSPTMDNGFLQLCSNNNAISSHQETAMSKQALSAQSKRGNNSELASIGTFQSENAICCRRLNQSTLMEDLRELEQETNTSKQCPLSEKTITGDRLAIAKANADAAFKAFLEGNERQDSTETDAETLVKDPVDQQDQDVDIEDSTKESDLNSSKKPDIVLLDADQQSASREYSFSTIDCRLSLADTCAKINTVFANKVDRKCLPARKNACKKAIKHVRFSIAPPRGEGSESPLVVVGIQKDMEFPKSRWCDTQNVSGRGHISDIYKSLNPMNCPIPMGAESQQDQDVAETHADILSSQRLSNDEMMSTCFKASRECNLTAQDTEPSNDRPVNDDKFPHSSGRCRARYDTSDDGKDTQISGIQPSRPRPPTVVTHKTTEMSQSVKTLQKEAEEFIKMVGKANDLDGPWIDTCYVKKPTPSLDRSLTSCLLSDSETCDFFDRDFAREHPRVIGHDKNINEEIHDNKKDEYLCEDEDPNKILNCVEQKNTTLCNTPDKTFGSIEQNAQPQRRENCDFSEESQSYQHEKYPDYNCVSPNKEANLERVNNLGKRDGQAAQHVESRLFPLGSTYTTSPSAASVSLPPINCQDWEGDSQSFHGCSVSESESTAAERSGFIDVASLSKDRNASRIALASNHLKNSECAISISPKGCGSPSQPGPKTSRVKLPPQNILASEMQLDGSPAQSKSRGDTPYMPETPRYEKPKTFPTKLSPQNTLACEMHLEVPSAQSTSRGDTPYMPETPRCEKLIFCSPQHENVSDNPAPTGFNIDHLRLPAMSALNSPGRDHDSIRPPPPSPRQVGAGLSYYSRDYLRSLRLTDIAKTFIQRRDKLLEGLDAVVTTTFYMPAVHISDWKMSQASATVIEVNYCSRELTRPQHRVDEDGCRLSTGRPLTVFYRQDQNGTPVW